MDAPLPSTEIVDIATLAEKSGGGGALAVETAGVAAS
jgi:hypothetical protein